MPSALNPISPELMGLLRRHPLWSSASDQAVRVILRQAQDLRFRAGERLFVAKQAADSIFLLVEGAARMFYPGPDKTTEITVVLFQAPAAFGDVEALADLPWQETVEALTSARALRININAYFDLLKSEPQLAARHYRDIASRFSVAIQRAQNTHFGDVTSRLVALLISYSNHFGKTLPSGERRIDHTLTRDELAVQVGSNRRSVARALADLQESKVIRRQGRRYVITSIERLLSVMPVRSSLSFSSGTPRPPAA